ncbi:MAG: 8-amino-7-oxononanoate synthase [Bacteroidota bacterium]
MEQSTAKREGFLSDALEKRAGQDLLRQLSVNKDLHDFCSNDYLGFARSQKLQIYISEGLSYLSSQAGQINGSTGSRLLSGNSALYEETERKIAAFHKAEAGLIFNSGYDANLGLFSSVPKKGDTILYDELAHASIIDGISLSYAASYKFAHNDVRQLGEKLKALKGNVFVAVESVYSMDGDLAPLKEMAELCERYQAHLIVDEAHATGFFGEQGQGLCAELGIESRVFARVHTFGKALGTHGAIVLGSDTLRSYLVNFARPFIYTTALPPHSLIAIRCAYRFLMERSDKIGLLKYLVGLFREKMAQYNGIRLIESQTPIQSLIIGGNAATRQAAAYLQEKGYLVKPILSPTVPAGTERLRICLHTFNSEREIFGLAGSINDFIFKNKISP